MKPIFLFCILFALACPSEAQFHLFKSKKQNNGLSQDSTTAAAQGFGTPVAKPIHKGKKNLILPLQPFYVLVGRVRDTSRVFLWLSIKDSAVRGMALYGVPQAVIAHKRARASAPVSDSAARKKDTAAMAAATANNATTKIDSAALADADSDAPGFDTLRLFGTVEPDGNLIFCAFSADGNMKDGFTGKILNDSVFQGKWFAMGTPKSLSCQLFTKDTVPVIKDSSLNADHVDGTYSYRIGDTGPAGGIIIHKVSSNSISIDLGTTSGTPDFSSAMLKSAALPFDGETAVYTSPGKPNCQLRIRVFKDFVVINYVGKMNQCNFGASVEGVFARFK